MGSNPFPRRSVRQNRTRVSPANVAVDKWICNSAVVNHPQLRGRGKRNRDRQARPYGRQVNPPFWNEDYFKGRLVTNNSDFQAVGLSNWFKLKSQRRKSWRIRQMHKKQEMAKGLAIKELPSDKGCLVVEKKLPGDVQNNRKMKSIVESDPIIGEGVFAGALKLNQNRKQRKQQWMVRQHSQEVYVELKDKSWPKNVAGQPVHFVTTKERIHNCAG